MTTDQQKDDRRNLLRIGTFIALVTITGLTLPLSAYVVEAVSSRAENWIMVVYVVVMALLGGTLGVAVGALTPPTSSRRRAALMWGGLGMLAAVIGAVIWLVVVGG